MIIPDNETLVDLLNNEPIAVNIVELLLEHEGEPVTIGVHGDWGAGKSSILQMVEDRLKSTDDVLCLRFDGWRFQGFEDAKIALIEGIVTELLQKRPTLTKATESVKNILKRIDWLKLAKHGGGAAITAFTGIPNPDQLRMATSLLGTVLSDPSKLVDKDQIKAALEGADGLLKPSEDTKRIPEEIQEFRKAFDQLLKDADIKQLIVLIDDLDRCLPKTVIETLEAIRLFVFTDKTAFVIAADEGMIEYSVREHFPDLPESSNSRDYARNYLEKLVQVPFRLPSLGELETKVYVSLLLIGAQLGESDEDFLKLASEAKEKMRKPWEGSSLEIEKINELLGEKAAQVNDAVFIGEQISHSLAAGTNGNPRQIKRFLNTLLLRQRAAQARGFGDEIEMPVLAKLMLAERFIPGLFDRIAQTAGNDPSGKCPELELLESSVKDDKAATDEKAPGDEGIPSEWLAEPTILTWARIEPPLATVDLRPYLFIAKERKDYYAGSPLSHKLAVLAEKLMSGQLAVKGMTSQIAALTSDEQVILFDFIQGRVIRESNLSAQPGGIEGLKLLAEVNPTLQSKLLDLLDKLPTAKLGIWCLKGWEPIFKSAETKSRLTQLLQKWVDAKDNQILSKAAKQVVSLPKKGS